MKIEDFKEIVKTITDINNFVKNLCITFGFIHKAEPIKYGEKFGFLVWDYILYNEITFISVDKEIIQRLFTSISDDVTENEFNVLVQKFKI